ncbi:hypothetical protein KP509_01G088200 [Ceratopteris richardii]|uniref:Phytocyanin domain-containing protein n=1 Tax=Ceratopteris richardii TaxID=49495 RepID=A0A8T2VRI3_CERRI|nr:hypothetical protein KP509_01G088200 [Ceratopteris richardii]
MAISQGRGMATNLLLMLAMLLVIRAHCSSAAVINVGDRVSWTLPSIDYSRWAASKGIRVNDVLRFTYSSELHNVLQVTKADYDSCGSRKPLAAYSNGNTMVRLPRRGTYYFICGVPGHCSAGMKMAVTVT